MSLMTVVLMPGQKTGSLPTRRALRGGPAKTKKYPALLYCQGGPQSPLTQSYSYRWNFSLMAAGDYIIVAPKRRGRYCDGREWKAIARPAWYSLL